MGFKIGEKISGFIFSVLLVAIIAVSMLSSVSTYDSMSLLIENVAKEQKMVPADFNEADFSAIKQDFMDNCSASGADSITVPLEDGNKNAIFDCDKVSAMNDSADLFAMVAVSGFKEIYYKQYNCSFIKCFAQTENAADKVSLVLSQKAHDFYTNSYWYVVAATVLVGIAYIFFAGDLFKAARGLGWTFAIIGIGFIFTLLFKDTGIPLGTGEQGASLTIPLAANIIAAMQNYFIIYFIVGIILLAVGYGSNYLKSKNAELGKDNTKKRKKG